LPHKNESDKKRPRTVKKSYSKVSLKAAQQIYTSEKSISAVECIEEKDQKLDQNQLDKEEIEKIMLVTRMNYLDK
jgi:hypothetical protein